MSATKARGAILLGGGTLVRNEIWSGGCLGGVADSFERRFCFRFGPATHGVMPEVVKLLGQALLNTKLKASLRHDFRVPNPYP